MKKLVNEIIRGRNLQENLPVFAGKMMGIYNDYSTVRLALNYFTYFEMVSEAENKSERLANIIDVFNRVVKIGVLENVSGDGLEELLSETENIRKQVINVMKGITSYVDLFNIYEYCLNRVEYKFTEPDKNLNVSDGKMAEDTLAYILSDSDNVVINAKISEVVRQLPVRMTKSRFFELLRAGLSIYKDSTVSDTEDFLYMLKTSSAMEISPYTEFLSEDIRSIREQFDKTVFSEITEEQYRELKGKLDYAVSYLRNEVSMYMAMGELINDVYVILVSKNYIIADTDDGKVGRNIIKNVNDMFGMESFSEVYDAVTDDFVNLEGRQEYLYGQFSAYEYVIDQAVEEHSQILSGLMLEPQYNSLKRIQLLVSGSIFVEFEEKNNSPADDEYINSITERLTDELKIFFGCHEKLMNRAVMAHILSEMPVFFNSVDEIQKYIYSSLTQCGDISEKYGVKDILGQLISEEQRMGDEF